MSIDPSKPLAQLVIESPTLARVFEDLGLDYCCRGERSLAEACRSAGLDLAAVREALERPPSGGNGESDWLGLPPAALADHIESIHHTYLHEELPRLEALLDKVVEAHRGRHPELVDIRDVYRELMADLLPHLMKEERVLFPLIREIERTGTTASARMHCGSVQNPISVMLAEHERAGELLEQLKQLTDGYQVPGDACPSFQELYRGLENLAFDTHLHIHKENNVLFPAVVALEERLGAG